MEENGNQIGIMRGSRSIDRRVIITEKIGRRDAFAHHLIILLAALILFLLVLLCCPRVSI